MVTRGLAFTVVLMALAGAASCSDETGGSTSNSTTSSSSGGESSSSSSSSSSSGMAGETINDCTAGAAEDQTGKADVTITFTSFAYTPACVKVSAGTKVTFSGDFASHPLVGGEVSGGTKFPDPASPFTMTNTGMMVDFTLASAGTFPYYCDFHTGQKMYGVVYVQ